MSNWVERRWQREQNMADLSDIWESVRTAIDNCCNSFRKYYADIADVENKTENGHRIVIVATFKPSGDKRHISVEFKESDQSIAVTVGSGSASKYRIDADEDHVFFRYGNEELSADGFTEKALAAWLFTPPTAPKQRSQSRPPYRPGQWS